MTIRSRHCTTPGPQKQSQHFLKLLCLSACFISMSTPCKWNGDSCSLSPRAIQDIRISINGLWCYLMMNEIVASTLTYRFDLAEDLMSFERSPYDDKLSKCVLCKKPKLYAYAVQSFDIKRPRTFHCLCSLYNADRLWVNNLPTILLHSPTEPYLAVSGEAAERNRKLSWSKNLRHLMYETCFSSVSSKQRAPCGDGIIAPGLGPVHPSEFLIHTSPAKSRLLRDLYIASPGVLRTELLISYL